MAVRNTITVKRGNTLVINYVNQDNAATPNPISMSGGTVYFTVKNTPGYDTDNTDSAAVLAINISVTSGNLATIKATATQILAILPGTYEYDITVKYANGDVITPFTAPFVVTGTPTNRGSV